MIWGLSWKIYSCSAGQEIPYFVEPEGLLVGSQGKSLSPTMSYIHSIFLHYIFNVNINVILPPTLLSPTWYLFRFSDKFCIYHLPIHATFSAHHVFIASIILNRMKSSRYEAFLYVIISIFLLLIVEIKFEDMNLIEL
jgi:hypothetical protein